MSPKTMELYLKGYNRSAERKAKADSQQADYEAWLQGAYFTNAIAACFDKRAKYPRYPSMYEEPEQDAANMANEFAAFARRFNANFRAER